MVYVLHSAADKHFGGQVRSPLRSRDCDGLVAGSAVAHRCATDPLVSVDSPPELRALPDPYPVGPGSSAIGAGSDVGDCHDALPRTAHRTEVLGCCGSGFLSAPARVVARVERLSPECRRLPVRPDVVVVGWDLAGRVPAYGSACTVCGCRHGLAAASSGLAARDWTIWMGLPSGSAVHAISSRPSHRCGDARAGAPLATRSA